MADTTKRGVTLRIPGTYDRTVAVKETEYVRITHSRTYRLGAARGAAVEPQPYTADWDEVAELEFQDGTRVWTSTRRLCSELVPPRERKRGADGVFELPAGLPSEDAARGTVGKALFKTLTFLGVDVAGQTASFIGRKWEEHTLGKPGEGRGPGVYRCATSGPFALTRCDGARKLSPDQPVLLFLHGTASSTSGSFGELWEPDKAELRKNLFQPYGENVLALEHGTLSTTPVQNAIDLLEQLGEILPAGGACLHVVSHSRGGLVGELLCRCGADGEPFSDQDLSWFAAQDPQRARGDLRKLNALLKKVGEVKEGKEPLLRVERFVRVACPTWGTTLASNRLDIYLSVLFNLLSKVPCLGAVPGVKIAYDIFSELIMLVAKERSDPSVLPGIEAMIPGSPLVQLLNRPECRVRGELRVIAGDIEAGSLTSALAALTADPLFGKENDLVVDTDAMFGGADRPKLAAYSFHHGPDVSHFRYFKNPESAERLVKALTRKKEQSDDFQPFEVTKSDAQKPVYKRGGAGDRPVVFVIPDTMATHLKVDDQRVWLDTGRLALGDLEKLRMGAPGVAPDEPVWTVYGRLVERLSDSHDVVVFPYDWRLSLQTEGARLAGELDGALQRTEGRQQPVSLIAHGTGGLLARAVAAYQPLIWQRLCRRLDSRLIMLGTPNRGCYWVQQLLTGRDRLLKQLALLDMQHDAGQLLQIISGWPGVVELLPEELLEPAQWERLVQAGPRRDLLQQARQVRSAIQQTQLDPDRVLYVAGKADLTPSGFAIEEDIDAKASLVFKATTEGDGKVTWESGIPAGIRTWYLPVPHGDLPSAEAHFGALLDLIAKGTTTEIDSVAPISRGANASFRIPEEGTVLYSGFEGVIQGALGTAAKSRRQKTRRRVRVSITHGNLAFTEYPLMLGHYRGDTIVSAEAHLDRIMGGRLRLRHDLGLYPGDDDTAEVFLNPTGRPAGAIIIGLGEVGKLSPGKLIQAVSRGVRAHALALTESCATLQEPVSCGIATLLIGTNAGGVSLEASVTAILRGVADAIQSLEEQREQRVNRQVVIEELEFIEVFEDRAIHAAHALDRARTDPEAALFFNIDPGLRVESRTGGLRRAYYSEEDHWWQRLEITENRAENLVFNLLTDRARSQVYLQQNQRSLAQEFIRQIIGSSEATGASVAATLFEMLVPNEIKDNAPERRDLVLVLNEEAARYPWEMMQERPTHNRGLRNSKPLSVQAGMIRQLQVKQFRERVVMARGMSALVIGNPKTPYVDLPAAGEEARKVHELLERHGYRSISHIGAEATGSAIINALYAGEYRIVHLAGHGVYQLEQRLSVSCDTCGADPIVNKVSGMVIGDGQYITPAQLAQMRTVPELVFVNCCHLGKVESTDQVPANYPPKLAANIAAELIRMGVKAVVAAGWEVSDEPAQQFATTFYAEMLNGASFGDAVLKARVTIFNAFPQVNTWGAYQCYGDHGFTLTPSEGRGRRAHGMKRYTAPAEVTTRLGNIAQEAKTADDERMKELREEIAQVELAIPAEWRDSGDLLASLGSAYGELQEYGKAVAFYEKALEDEAAPCPVKAVEQRWNLQARWAVEVAGKDLPEAKRMIRQSEEQLASLINALGESSERRCLLGSAAKREAMVQENVNEKRQALRKMAQHYTEANDRKKRKTGKNDFYPYINQLTATVLDAFLTEGGVIPEYVAKGIKEERALAEAKRGSRDFWQNVELADYLLLEHLAKRDVAGEVESITKAYLEVRKSNGSPREWASVLEHLDFLIKTLDVAQPEVREQLLVPLAEIRGKLVAASV